MYKIHGSYILNKDTNEQFPQTETNRHYREYLEWLNDGNKVEPEFTESELLEKQKQEDEANKEQLIQEKMREMAIEILINEGKISL